MKWARKKELLSVLWYSNLSQQTAALGRQKGQEGWRARAAPRVWLERPGWPQAARPEQEPVTRTNWESLGRTQSGGAGITEQGSRGKGSTSQRRGSVCAGCKAWEVGHLGHRSKNRECGWVNTHASAHSKLPFLSPVSTQILMSAFASFEMVSGTPSWSLSSIAVAPKSCKEHF